MSASGSSSGAPHGEGENTTPKLRVLAQYVKDASFENPSPHAIGKKMGAPEIELSIHVHAEARSEPANAAEVSLKMAARARHEKKTVFVVELTYAGIFVFDNVPKKESEAMLLVEAPRLLFPFARHLIADITREGGFPPMMIDPIDFVSLYKSHQEAGKKSISGAMTSTTAH